MKMVASFLILVASVAAGGCAQDTAGAPQGAAVGRAAVAAGPSEADLRARQSAWTSADAGRQCGYWPAGDDWSFYGYCYEGADPKYVGLDHDPNN